MQKYVNFETLVALGYVNNRVTLSRRVRRGEFPAPIRIGSRNVAWLRAEIESWEVERLAERARRAPLVDTGDNTAATQTPTQRSTQTATQASARRRGAGDA